MTIKKGCNGWRPSRDHYPKGSWDETVASPPIFFFDNMAFIGNDKYACFLVTTSEGLILLDCMNPGDETYIESCIEELGYDPAELKAILITHGHYDHFGNAGYFQQKYGTRLYMSQIDEYLAQNEPESPDVVMTFSMDGYLEDQGAFTLGDVTIRTYLTPGHSPGCMSFIVPVTDEGRPHKVMIWGGTGISEIPAWQKQYKESALYFLQQCLREGVDAEVSNHPFVDQLIERLNVVRVITNGTANPMVIGTDAVARNILMFYDLVEKRAAAGLVQGPQNGFPELDA